MEFYKKRNLEGLDYGLNSKACYLNFEGEKILKMLLKHGKEAGPGDTSLWQEKPRAESSIGGIPSSYTDPKVANSGFFST